MAILTVIFLVKHVYYGNFEWTETVNVYVPRMLMMSSYGENEALDYAGSMVLVLVVLVVSALRKWVAEDLQ